MELLAGRQMVLGRFNSKVNLIELFKVPLFGSILDLDITSIEKYCLDYQNKDEGRILSNVGGYQSKEVRILPLIRELNKNLNILADTHGIDDELTVGNMWININQFKDYNGAHVHPNALFSGVYYVKAPDKCGNIIFEHPAQDVMNYTYDATNLKEYNQYNSITYWREAKENLLYIFPAWLKHSVAPNLSNEKRISISFNIGIYSNADI